MYLLYTDETNMDPNDTKFFIYGGIAISVDRAHLLSKGIESKRLARGISPTDILKFNTRACASIKKETHKEIKQEIIQLAVEHGVQLFLSIVNHKISKTPEEARKFGINTIGLNFNNFLESKDDYGLVIVDRFDDEFDHLIVKFNEGITGNAFPTAVRLSRILGFHVSAIGTSHFTSLIDIVLGGVRYAINSFSDPNKIKVSNTLMKQIAPLFHKDKDGSVSKLGIDYCPKSITTRRYYDEYMGIDEFLSSAGIETHNKPNYKSAI